MSVVHGDFSLTMLVDILSPYPALLASPGPVCQQHIIFRAPFRYTHVGRIGTGA